MLTKADIAKWAVRAEKERKVLIYIQNRAAVEWPVTAIPAKLSLAVPADWYLRIDGGTGDCDVVQSIPEEL